MKKAPAIILLLILVSTLEGQQTRRLVILHTNDLHSRLTGYAPESAYTPLSCGDDSTTGGFARIAGIIKAERDKSGTSLLVLDAGDFFMGTLFPFLESETGFQLRLMKRMGYDAAALGNHEFDFGPAWLAGVISTSAEKGEIPSLVSSNLRFDDKDGKDDSLEKLFSDHLISRKLIIERGGLKIGIFSVLGKEAAGFAPEAAPVTFESRISIAKDMVKELQDAKCDIIICLSHSGIVKEKKGEWGGEDFELARKVNSISLIIGGHSHTRLDKPLVVNGIPIVQTGEFGKFVGRLSLLFSGAKVSVEDYRLIPVNDKIDADKDIDQMIEEQKQMISVKVLNPLGLTYAGPVAKAGFVIEGNDTGNNFADSNLGPLVADAIHTCVNSQNSMGTDVSIVAAGMLFDRILPGIQTAPDIFRIVPLGSGSDNVPGYPLARLYITGKELKNVLEVLQVAYKSSADNYCFYSGLRVEYDPEKGFLRKIKKIDIVHRDGTLGNVDFNRKNKTLYSITADSYMLEFIGIIRKKSFGIVNVVPKDRNGLKIKDMKSTVIDMDEERDGIQEGKEWLALIKYLSLMKDTDSDGIPDIDPKYSVPVKCFFTVNGK
jgi:5'-nucleotidase / UDP-sugar diphosphatase